MSLLLYFMVAFLSSATATRRCSPVAVSRSAWTGSARADTGRSQPSCPSGARKPRGPTIPSPSVTRSSAWSETECSCTLPAGCSGASGSCATTTGTFCVWLPRLTASSCPTITIAISPLRTPNSEK